MKKLLTILLALSLTACNSNTVNEKAEETKKLPVKKDPQATRMSESPLSASNIDEYLNLDGVLYFDCRDEDFVKEEGIINGFTCVPFYGLLCDISDNQKLFSSNVKKDENGNKVISLFEVGSFNANYNESLSILESLFPKDKQLVFIASAGVESCYLMNMLIQFGWDASKLYNAGAFSNSLGANIAYRDLKKMENFLDGDLYEMPEYKFELTRKDA